MGGNKQFFNINVYFRSERGCGRVQHTSKGLLSSFGEVLRKFDNVARKVAFAAEVTSVTYRKTITTSDLPQKKKVM